MTPLQQHHDVLGSERGESLERQVDRRRALVTDDRGVPVEGVQALDIVWVPLDRRAIGDQSEVGPAAPLEHVAPDEKEVGSSGRPLEGLVDPGQRLHALLLSERCHRQVGEGEGILRSHLGKLGEGGFGVSGLLILELGDALVSQRERLGPKGQQEQEREQEREGAERSGHEADCTGEGAGA